MGLRLDSVPPKPRKHTKHNHTPVSAGVAITFSPSRLHKPVLIHINAIVQKLASGTFGGHSY